MLTKFKKKIAATLNVLMVLQLVLFGAFANPDMVSATGLTDDTAPVLENVGFTYKTSADGLSVKMAKDANGNFVLPQDELASTDYLLSFDSTTTLSEALSDEVFGLYLDATTADRNRLVEYYSSKPEPFKTYLLEALEGEQPFAYIQGGAVEDVMLLDAAKYQVGLQSEMTIPGDFPSGVYKVSGLIDDEFGNVTLVNFGLNVIGTKPTLTLTDGQADNYLRDGEKVNFTASFSEAVVPKISIGTSVYDMIKTGDNIWKYEWIVIETTNRTVDVVISGTDNVGLMTSKTMSYVVDNTAPVITVTTEPTIVGDMSKVQKVFFTGSERIVLNRLLNPGQLGTGNVPVNFKQIVDGSELSLDGTLKPVDAYIFSADLPVGFSGANPLNVTVNFYDLAGNLSTESTWEIKVDNKVPEKVTELSAVVNEVGHVVLNWTNPKVEADYKEIRIFRNDEKAPIAVLPLGTTTFVDTSVEKGQTYYYDVVIVDNAGNFSEVPRASVSTPAPVVAVASDSFVVTAPRTAQKEEVKPAEQEVKSETTENKVEENKEKKEFPIWGLILLLALAGVGGYLYYSKEDVQKPTVKKAAPVTVKSTGKSTKKKVKK